MSIQSAENILLLGAGFTKNFGGLLADEMWAEIFNHDEVQAQPRIKQLMRNNFDYESIYYSVLSRGIAGDAFSHDEYKKEEKNAVMIATKSAYDHIDRILRYNIVDESYKKWHNNVNELLLKFGITKNNSFIFTLNQDLFVERFYLNPSKGRPCRYPEAILSIPGIDNIPDWFMNRNYYLDGKELSNEQFRFLYTDDLKRSDYLQLPSEDELKLKKDNLLGDGSHFLIKLHGSYNWKSADGSDLMVIGRGKSKQIQNEPLLNHYFKIFEDVFSQDNHRLLVIGYGFGDKHINRVIANAVKDHNLKIYILSPESPKKLKENLSRGMNKINETGNIWNGISGYFQCVDEVLKSEYNKNQIVRKHFYSTFFGESNSST